MPANKSANNKEKYRNIEYGNFVDNLNPKVDLAGVFQLTGLYIDRIYNRMNVLGEDVKMGADVSRHAAHRVDELQRSLTETLESR